MKVVNNEIAANNLPGILTNPISGGVTLPDIPANIVSIPADYADLTVKKKVILAEEMISYVAEEERESLHRRLCPNPKEWAEVGFSKAFRICRSLIKAKRHSEAAEVLPIVVKNNSMSEDIVAEIADTVASAGLVREACDAWIKACRYYAKKSVNELIDRFALNYLNPEQRKEFFKDVSKNISEEMKIGTHHLPLEKKLLIGFELLARSELDTLYKVITAFTSETDRNLFLSGLNNEIAESKLRQNLFKFICRPDMQGIIPPGYVRSFFTMKSADVCREETVYSQILKDGSLSLSKRDARACFGVFKEPAYRLCADLMEAFFLRGKSDSLALSYVKFLTKDYPGKESSGRISKFLTLCPAYAPAIAANIIKWGQFERQETRFHLWSGLNTANPHLAQACLWQQARIGKPAHIVGPLYGALLPKDTITELKPIAVQSLNLLAVVAKTYQGVFKQQFFRSISLLEESGVLKEADMQNIVDKFNNSSLGEMRPLYKDALLTL